MDSLTAIQIIEGDIGSDREELIAAWQHMVDTGLAWKLQGSYGRQAMGMINRGVIFPRIPETA